VVKTVNAMQLAAWRNFENYTGPLGAQTLTEITGNHYGPAVEASERNGWGQWHRADEKGIGMDRTVATGTGFIGQYRPDVAKVYEPLATCPDELLLWMHHVPYTHVLHSGKTVIQHIYDTHYEGAAAAAGYVTQWESLAGRIDEPRYLGVLARLEYQAGHAEVWRDAINSWFRKTSGIPDARSRVGAAPGRQEAEKMQLEGYTAVEVQRFETASDGKAIACSDFAKGCAASLAFDGKAGWYDLNVRYFDQVDGVSRFRLLVAGQLIDEWTAPDDIPTRDIDGHSATRRLVRGVALRPGDTIRIEGMPDGGERAPLDFVEILPAQGR
jgi:alpha-glucuronidase